MKSAGLEAELAAAIRQLTTEDAEELADLGVDPFDIVIFGMVGFQPVRLDKSGWFWEPEWDAQPGTRTAFITPVRADFIGSAQSEDPWAMARFGDLVDLIAWDPAAPERWALRTANAAYLGSALWGEPFPPMIRASPLSWLKANCDGLVLLTRDPVLLRAALDEFHEHGVDVETAALAHRLDELVRQPVARPPLIRAPGRAGAGRQGEAAPHRGPPPDTGNYYTPLREEG